MDSGNTLSGFQSMTDFGPALSADGLDFARSELLPQSGDHLLGGITGTITPVPCKADVTANDIEAIASSHGEAASDVVPDDAGGELAKEPDILRVLVGDLKLAGLAGEERVAQIIFLAA